ncbi:MAG: protein kinase [Candidatus Brocadiae bacterium]|nr:protein kinase [Candidatus Brocadiia bacterium]
MAEAADPTLQAVTKAGLCTPEQIQDGLDIQQKMRDMGISPKPLAEILLDKGHLTKEQYREIAAKPLSDRGTLEKDTIPGYELQKKIGQGGMGAVFQARQISMDRIVALKVLPPKLAKDSGFRERFLREARAVAKLNHENIIQGIDVGVAAGLYYFVMEFVDGQTISKQLTDGKWLPEKDALGIGMQIAKALEHAHRHKLVHRDVKPENIMVTRDGVAKLCDLGLAKQEQGDVGLTQAGLAVGTPNYISPEQARGEADTDIRSDIYSLGASLYHLLTGKVPFDGTVPSVVMTKHITEDLVPPIKVKTDLSPEANAIVVKAMQKRREDRYEEPGQMALDLENALSGRPLVHAKVASAKKTLSPAVPIAPAGGPPGESGHKPRLAAVHRDSVPRKGNPAVPIAVASIAALAILGGAIALTRGKKPAPEPDGGKTASTPSGSKTGESTTGEKPPDVPIVDLDAEREKKIDAEFKALTGFIEVNRNDPVRYRDIEERIEEFLAAHRKTDWENRGIAERQKFRDGLDVSARALLQQIEKEIAPIRGEGRLFAAILAAESKWMPHLNGTPTAETYTALLDSLRKDIETRWAKDRGASTALRDAREFDKAIAALEGVKSYGSPVVVEQADRLREEIRKAAEDYAVQLAEIGRRRFDTEFWPGLEKLLYERKYKEALSHCGQFMQDPEMIEVRERISAMIDDVTSMNMILVEAARGADVAIKSKEKLPIKNFEVRISSRDGDRVGYSFLTGGSSELQLTRAEEVDIAVLCTVALNALPAEKKASERGAHHFRLGLLFYFTADERDRKRAAEEMDRASKESVERAKWYLERLGELALGETELAAKKIYDEALDAFNAKRYPEAKGKFQRLLSEFAATAWVKDRKDTIQKRLAECDGKVGGTDNAGLQSILKGQVVRTYPKGAVEIKYDFSREDQLQDWTVAGGTWRWDKDAQAMSGSATDEVTRGISWNVPMTGDLSVELDITPGVEKNIGMSVCNDGAGRSYMALLGGVLNPQLLGALGNPDFKQIALIKWAGGEQPPFVTLGAATDPKPVRGQTVRVRISRAGKNVSVYLGGKKVLEAQDEDYRKGTLGFFLLGSDAKFDEITIYGTPDDAWVKARLGGK